METMIGDSLVGTAWGTSKVDSSLETPKVIIDILVDFSVSKIIAVLSMGSFEDRLGSVNVKIHLV